MSGLVTARRMSTAELARWRAGRQVASSPIPKPDGPAEPIRVPAQEKPLGARETHDSMFAQLYANQRKNRGAYERAVRWMRATQPNAFGHLTDTQLRDYLDMRCREAVDRIVRQKRLNKPAIVNL